MKEKYQNRQAIVEQLCCRTVKDIHLINESYYHSYNIEDIEELVNFWVSKFFDLTDKEFQDWLETDEYEKKIDAMSLLENRIYLRLVHSCSCQKCQLFFLPDETESFKYIEDHADNIDHAYELMKDDDIDVIPTEWNYHIKHFKDSLK